MSSRVLLVHYHEIGLKGHNRGDFERRLVQNLRAALNGLPVLHVDRISGHILVRFDESASSDDIQKTFEVVQATPGVARVSNATCCQMSLEDVNRAALDELLHSGDFETFKVAARKSNTTFEYGSLDLNRLVGEYLCENLPTKRVLMRDPDRTVVVYAIQGFVYVYVQSELGVGGLPVGSASKVISLLSSGIDSPVASWRMMRRGAVVVGLHFSGRPQTSDASEWLVQDIIDKLSPTAGFGRLYVVPFGDFQRKIASLVPDDLRILMYRRMMFAFACKLAYYENAKALVTGESLGQVASQTLENILAVDEMSTLPVLRPLIGNDKREIMQEARNLGTLELSTENAPDCCTLFMPRTPETHAKLDEIHRVWNLFDHDTMLEEMWDTLEYRSYNCPNYKAPRFARDTHECLSKL